MSKPLERLIRLHRAGLDRQRQALMTAASEVQAIERQLQDLKADRAREVGLAHDAPFMLAGYLRRMQVQEVRLHEALGQASAVQADLGQRLRLARLELRRLEILWERQRARAARATARRDQRALDDLVVARYARADAGT